MKRSLKSDKKKWLGSIESVTEKAFMWSENTTEHQSIVLMDKVRTFSVEKEEVQKHCYNTLKKN